LQDDSIGTYYWLQRLEGFEINETKKWDEFISSTLVLKFSFHNLTRLLEEIESRLEKNPFFKLLKDDKTMTSYLGYKIWVIKFDLENEERQRRNRDVVSGSAMSVADEGVQEGERDVNKHK
jgi:hypothetical protein